METNALKHQIDIAFERERLYGLQQGIRKFKHGEMYKNVWFVHSIKNNANIACESDIEKQLCMNMEFEEAIRRYRPQPFKLKFADFSYTPDFIVEFHNGLYAVREAKRRAEAESNHYKERFEIIRQYCEANGVSFEVFTDNDLSKTDSNNRDFLYHLIRGSAVDEQAIHDCLSFLHKSNIEPTPLSVVRKFVAEQGFNPDVITHLIVRGSLISNLSQETGMNAYVSLRKNGGEV